MKSSTILFKHALKGTLLPIVSYLGPAFAGVVTGSVVVESVFRIPGLGKFFVQSSFNRDYTLIVGVVIVYSVHPDLHELHSRYPVFASRSENHL